MISKKEVEHVAELARIGLTKREIEKFQKELSLILDYVGQLKKVNVKGIQPTSHFTFAKNVFRKDEIIKTSPAQVKKIIDQIPDKEKNYAKVKTVLK